MDGPNHHSEAAHWQTRKKILVTGGCGFIGSALVRQLVSDGEDVVVLDSLRYGQKSNLLEAQKSVKIIRFNIGFDDVQTVLPDLLDVSHVFHLAAEKSNQLQTKPTDILRTNIEGMHDLLVALCESSAQKVVFTSSLYAYGRVSGGPLIETEVAQPPTLYGLSKLTGENMLSYLRAKFDVQACGLRVFFTYGPRQFAGSGYKSVIVKNFERILQGKPPVVFGDGLQTLDYIYVDDVINALICAMTGSLNINVVNVSSAQPVNILTLTNRMLTATGSSLSPEFGPADWTANTSRVGDNSLIRNLLGWQPRTSLDEGLADTLSWMRQQVKA